jgi:hypothetical protein
MALVVGVDYRIVLLWIGVPRLDLRDDVKSATQEASSARFEGQLIELAPI